MCYSSFIKSHTQNRYPFHPKICAHENRDLRGYSLSKTLGKKYIEAGINVVFGVSPEFDVEEPEWKSLNKFYHRLAPYESAIIQGEFILLCNENGDLPEIWVALKNSDTEGKIIIDCTNGAFDTKTGFLTPL